MKMFPTAQLEKFVQKVKAENGLARDEDIFLHWDAIKEEYIRADAVRERGKKQNKKNGRKTTQSKLRAALFLLHFLYQSIKTNKNYLHSDLF